uniref:Uncharacterized protein n=1 Tax=Lactuca sativa TaxID=4236 RepID=A0A9R1UYB9_LACSA|nr:hypothetical protein LSAT_V11C700367400 [Lactuca sativa]
MTKKTTGEPSEPPHSPIHPMASLEPTNTPAAPSSGGPPPSLEAAPSSSGPPHLSKQRHHPVAYHCLLNHNHHLVACHHLLRQHHHPSQTSPSSLTHATPPPFSNNGVPNQYIVPPLTPFFPNIIGSSNPQTPPITPFVNILHTNITIIGPSVIPQPQNHPSLMASTASTSPLMLYQQIPMAQQQISMGQQQIPMDQQQIPMT